MTIEARKLLEKALTLPPVERAELVEQTLSSFEFPARGEIDALWASESEAFPRELVVAARAGSERLYPRLRAH